MKFDQYLCGNLLTSPVINVFPMSHPQNIVPFVITALVVPHPTITELRLMFVMVKYELVNLGNRSEISKIDSTTW